MQSHRTVQRFVVILGIAWRVSTLGCGDPDAVSPDAAVDAYTVGADVVTEYGPLRGTTDGELVVFKGVPYAAPPTAERRFAPPVPPAIWTEPRDATSFGPACPQGGANDSEDCLSLNVWAHGGSDTRAVIVWIHGGGYVAGASRDAVYDAASLARISNAVVVSINYRLGKLGFLAHPQLAAPDGGAGNWGLRDQIAALQWIQRNIGAFGGDPTKVLIAGESAGGASICTLLATAPAQGLYQSAIMQSGNCRLVQEREAAVGTFPAAYTVGAAVAGQLGCTTGDIASCLRSAPLASVLAATVPLSNDLGFPVFATLPIVDGVVLDARPMAAIRGGRGNVPTIAGSNREDTSVFMINAMGVTNAPGAFQTYLDKLPLTPSQKSALLSMYPPSVFTELGAAIYYSTDLAFACPARVLASVHADRTRLYELERPVPSGPLMALRAVHGLDFIYLFGTFAQWQIALTAADDALHGWFAQTWGSMARDELSATWPAGGANADYLGIDASQTMRSGFRGARCAQLGSLGVLIE